MSDLQGKVVYGYTLQSLLGMGGMAEVWLGENKIGKKAAVKLLLPKFCDDKNVVERFLTEAKVMVALNHPNIRQVYDYESIEGRPTIVMEYLEGDDLKAMMKKGQRFTDAELVKWWDQLVDALNYTHQQGIVHRDIKPGNIFVDTFGNIKLLDFGIAKVRESISSTQTGQKIGTLMYMSPEQVKDSKHIDYHTDIYSLAVTFVHLLTGKKPYDSDTCSDFDIQLGIVSKPLDLSGVPAGWRGFLAPYLEKDASKRPELRHFVPTVETDRCPSPKPDANPVPNHDKNSSKPDEPNNNDEGTIVGDTSTDNDATSVETDEKPSQKPSPKPDKTPSPKPQPAPKKKKSLTWLWILIAVLAVGGGVYVMMNNNPKNPTDPTSSKDNVKDNVGRPIETIESPETHVSIEFAQDTFGRSQAHAPEPVVVDPEIDDDTEAFHACKTIADYRSYIADYGRNGKHYSEAKAKVDKHVNDSLQKVKVAEESKKREEEARKREEANALKNKSFTVNGVTFEMIAVKGGTFTMGCTSEHGDDCNDDEKPSHSVTLSDYYIGKFEVTQELWYAVMGTTVRQQRDKGDKSWSLSGEGNNYPMYYISWNECQEFVRKLNQLTGHNFRLPTEAEWEYAARGGNKSNGYKYSGSNSIDNVAWYTGNSGKKAHPVGTKSPNELGIYDMSGNVYEWCQDWYGDYNNGSQTNPTGPSSGSARVLRGGYWICHESFCRVSNRELRFPGHRNDNYGFRLALVP